MTLLIICNAAESVASYYVFMYLKNEVGFISLWINKMLEMESISLVRSMALLLMIRLICFGFYPKLYVKGCRSIANVAERLYRTNYCSMKTFYVLKSAIGLALSVNG